MDLLQQPVEQGYPEEYLLARIKGRRSGLVRDWNALIFEQEIGAASPHLQTDRDQASAASDRIWEELLEEYEWVYRQMDRHLRKVFAPYFLHAEVRTIILCLRRIQDSASGVISELLNHSLLSRGIKDVLLQGDNLQSVLKSIERLFSDWSKDFSGLSDVLEHDGLRGVEQRLAETTLMVIARSVLHPPLKAFFIRLIDARNIMSIFKYVRFERAAEPHVQHGGSFPNLKLRSIMAKGDITALRGTIREATGIVLDKLEPMQVERALYQGITRWLRRAGREPFGAAPILDYLWRCSIEAMNLSVLHHARGLERDLVTAELVT